MGEIVVQVCAVDMSATEARLISGRPHLARGAGLGVLRPRTKTPGQAFAGTVAAIGDGVTGLSIGDAVVAEDEHGRGALAQFKAVSAALAVPVPHSVDLVSAATLPSAGVALQALRDAARVPLGASVLVHGAAGGVGHFAVQIACGTGADVTASFRGDHHQWLGALGARRTVDTNENSPFAQPQAYDAIIDLAGHPSLRDIRRALTPRGVYVGVGGKHGSRLGAPFRAARVAASSATSRRTLRTFPAGPSRRDLAHIATTAGAGRLIPFIGATFPLERVADALDAVLSGGSRGKTVISIE